MASFEHITRHVDGDPGDVQFVGEDQPPTPIAVVDADRSWPAHYAVLAARIRDALGAQVLALDHVGSTSVPGLPAKPIIDIDLTVADNCDEAAYLPPLEAAGFRLRIREPRWYEHRLLVSTAPRANLHVWGPGSPEAIRHRLFRDWLRDHPDDRDRYAAAKREAAAACNATQESVMRYNRRKQPVVRDILDRMFRAHGML